MGMLPKLSGSELVRTDFTDSAAWEQASTEAQQGNADGFRACIEPVSDPAFDAAVLGGGEGGGNRRR